MRKLPHAREGLALGLSPRLLLSTGSLWFSLEGKTVNPLADTNLHGYQVHQKVKVSAINPTCLPSVGNITPLSLQNTFLQSLLFAA